MTSDDEALSVPPASRPALDVDLTSVSSPAASDLADQIEALVDDFRPYAVEDGADVDPATAAGPVTRRIHFFDAADRDAAMACLRARPAPWGHVRAVDLPDDGAAWAARTQADLTAVTVDRIVVAPPWDPRPAPPGGHRIEIRPSRGFGTGHHATTRLCLTALQREAQPGGDALDVGTGSGVLAIAAAHLGMTVRAFESDPDAWACARENVEANGVAARIALEPVAFGATTGTAGADLVLANLTGAVLIALAESLARCTRPGGHLVVSGLTQSEEADVRTALSSWTRLTRREQADEWLCLTLGR